MANEKNIRDSIEVLKRVRDNKGKFNLKYWQNICRLGQIATTEKELHTCEMSACIGGYIAVSPEFKAVGGSVTGTGAPRLHYCKGFEALAEYWGVDIEEVELICDMDQFTLEYYGVDSIDDITIDMAIEAVESLLKLED